MTKAELKQRAKAIKIMGGFELKALFKTISMSFLEHEDKYFLYEKIEQREQELLNASRADAMVEFSEIKND
ncbi:MAG: hypothetical protein IBX43_05150 [Campylobacterales bacterium]|nr:hypothetical protein [Campylobacterales bacterium]